jgi:hypothetical protein
LIYDQGIRNAILLVIAVVAFTLLTGAFHGVKTETWSIPVGNALFIATPCADSVTINADANLRGAVQIVAKAHDKAQIMQLASHGGSAAFLSGVGSHCLGASLCKEAEAVCAGQPDNPNLTLTLTVPAGLPINITEAQGTDYTIGDTNGPLTVSSTGTGDVSAGAITGLKADLAGDGDLQIARATGPIVATLSKNGDLDIANANAPATTLTLDGDGDVNIAAGNLGALNATLSKAGDLRVPASSSAALVLSADGDVDLGPVSGQLTATLTGDGDLSVARVGGDANIRSTANGDVTIPHVAGRLTQSNTGDGDFKINGS